MSQTEKIVSDYYIEQFIIEEVKNEDKETFFKEFKTKYSNKYNFENLEIAEYIVVDQEITEESAIYTIRIIWTNKQEVITEDEEQLSLMIYEEKDKLIHDDNTIIVYHEIETIKKIGELSYAN